MMSKGDNIGRAQVFMILEYSLPPRVSRNFRIFCLFVLVPGSGLWPSISSSSEPPSPPREINGDAAEASAREKLLFDILDIQIEGNTVLPRMVVEKTIYPFMGENKTIDDLEAARKMLEQRYKESGFVTVFV